MERQAALFSCGLVLGLGALANYAAAQDQATSAKSCQNTPAYSTCEIVFELSAQDAAAHPNPYLNVELKAQFRSPHHRTYGMTAFWDGGQRMVIRFAPTEPGDWDYLVSSNIGAWDGKTGTFTAAASDAPGFVRTANVHHFAYTERNLPHLWMGATEMGFASLDDTQFHALVDARAAQKFNHLRGLVLGEGPDAGFSSPNQPDFGRFRRLDERLRYLNQKGITADLVMVTGPETVTKQFPNREERRRLARYLAARYSAYNVTWQLFDHFEDFPDARALAKEMGLVVKETDPYQHPRSSGARVTSAPLLEDKWMDYAAYGTGDDTVGAVEHQLYPVPFVNLNFGREDSGAGTSGPNDMDAAAQRHRLWNSAMDGQYVTYSNTGAGPQYADAPGAKQMTVWFNLFSETRHWELEPYFDVDGGRALALEGVEYVVYIEKPGPLELLVEKHDYEVLWINPADGAVTRAKFKGDHFTSEPPDRSHDWVLHVVREGRLESMNKSYYFESRPVLLQELEQSPEKVPFEIEQPAADVIAGKPVAYSAKIKRETRATRSVMWLWTGEVAADGQGYRVLGTGQKGSFSVPATLAKNFPAVMNVRLFAMNSNGKVYALDRALQLNR